jgi:hypothetical protein
VEKIGNFLKTNITGYYFLCKNSCLLGQNNYQNHNIDPLSSKHEKQGIVLLQEKLYIFFVVHCDAASSNPFLEKPAKRMSAKLYTHLVNETLPDSCTLFKIVFFLQKFFWGGNKISFVTLYSDTASVT